MSELMNASARRNAVRRQLLSTVSALAVLGSISGTVAKADDENDKPVVWIELGGQWSRLNEPEEAFTPSLMAERPSNLMPVGSFQQLPPSSIDETGKLSFEPTDSDWVFSASVRYGRSSSNRHVHQQSHPGAFYHKKYRATYTLTNVYQPVAARFADTAVQNDANHLVVDFQAGKDVGLGIFGKNSESTLNLGVRFAQFGTKSDITLKSDPDWRFGYERLPPPFGTIFGGVIHQYYHSNQARLMAQRGFHGVGPSLSWNASVPFIGNSQSSELALDWGLNGAILFGRQKAKIALQTTAQYHHQPSLVQTSPGKRDILYQDATTKDRNRSVTVPNIGGFAGMSFLYANAKVSFGYRADLFFHAMDGGIDTRKSENVGFYGPFASVSVGLGG